MTIRAIITDIARTGKTIILASHLLDEVAKVCDRVIILKKGKKIPGRETGFHPGHTHQTFTQRDPPKNPKIPKTKLV